MDKLHIGNHYLCRPILLSLFKFEYAEGMTQKELYKKKQMKIRLILERGWKNDSQYDYVATTDKLLSFLLQEIKRERDELKKQIKLWSYKELVKQTNRAIKTNDEVKSRLAGYASGVVSRMLRELSQP